MTTTYSIHPPGGTAASRGLLSHHHHHHHHHHSHSPHQQHRRHQASSLDSIRTTATIITPSSLQRVVSGADSIAATATPPASIGVIPPPPALPFDTIAAPNPAIAALNGTICRPSSSDCGGSSSGLGGMTKTDIISSDESSLARRYRRDCSPTMIAIE
ncbi:unnamed protein product [Litomosoides sigmodontis]|uniref:Uncharacterized protein n=1 Tax=Litomosoides sigmodontis TaxID=42156 RepID=A0A3P6VFG5_LITSI|nr:unnamed protein product [Litomosoides sigmodontis]